MMRAALLHLHLREPGVAPRSEQFLLHVGQHLAGHIVDIRLDQEHRPRRAWAIRRPEAEHVLASLGSRVPAP
jgi:hypothetical protein